LFALVNALGLRSASEVQKFSSGIKGLALLLFCLACFTLSPSDSGEPRAPPVVASLTAVAIALQLILGTYGGWNAPIYCAGETRDPTRNLRRSLFAGAVLLTLIYLMVNTALLHALSMEQLAASKLPAADAMEHVFGGHSGHIVTILALALLLSIINAGVLATPRVLVGLSRDRFIAEAASRITARGVPGIALTVTMLTALILVATGTFTTLLAHYATVAIAINICVAASFFRLRRSEPALARPFRAWGYPVAPLLVMLVDVALLIGLVISETRSTLYTLLMLLTAFPLYLLCKRWVGTVPIP
jgi:APA family basic amino acid/polyamine antiporter